MVKEGDILHQSEKELETILEEKQIPTSGTVSSLQELEEVVNSILATLPKLNRAKLRKEMEEMVVELKENPTTDDLNKGLAKAQGYKDRLAEIYTLALREYKIRNRCLEMLFDAVNYVSTAKSADKRKGEATMRYPMMIIHKEAAETFLKEVEHVLQNIKSAHDSVSRQVSVAQLQLQLGELRKGSNNSNIAPQGQAEEISRTNNGKELDWDSF